MNIALIIAGGKGVRMHQEIPKQFLTVNEKPVIVYTMEAFQKHADIDAIAVVCIAGWENILSAYARQYGITKLQHIIPGGENGQSSIRNGVMELEKHYSRDDLVLVHDPTASPPPPSTARPSPWCPARRPCWRPPTRSPPAQATPART